MLRAPTPKHIKGKEATQLSRFRTGHVANKGNYILVAKSGIQIYQSNERIARISNTRHGGVCYIPPSAPIHPRRPFP
jgi:hypothetical protein